MGLITCPNCGNKFEGIPGKSMVFCSECGTAIDVENITAQEEPAIQQPEVVASEAPEAIQPEYQEPVQPEYQEPVQPEYQEPVQPEYQESVQPEYQEPVQPEYQEPVQPEYQESVQPEYQQYNAAPQQPYNQYGAAPQQPYQQPYNQYGAAPQQSYQQTGQQPYNQYGAAPQQPYQQAYQQPYNQGYPVATQPVKKSSNTPIIAAAVVTGLALIIALYLLVLKPIYITSIEFDTDDINSDKDAIVLDVGDTYELEYSLAPENNRHDDLIWTSSDDDVATVKDGIVTAVGQGECTIEVISEKGITANIDISVETVAEKISLTKTSVEVDVGNTAVISVNFVPQDTTDKHCTWESDDTSVATINDGIVKGVGEGTCTITVTSVYGPSATCTVTVTKPKPESLIVGTWNGYYAKSDSTKLNLKQGDVVFIINSDGTAVHYFADYTYNMTWKYMKTDEDGDYVYYFYYENGSRANVYYLNSGSDAGEIQFANNGVHVWYTKSATDT